MAETGSHSYIVKSGTPFVELTIIEKPRKGLAAIYQHGII